MILEQLDREAELTRRALERVPKGKNDWKPHPKSMPLGQLAHMVATMPSWISMIVKQDEIDIKPKDGARNGASRNLESPEALVKALDKAVTDARDAVSATTDGDLQTLGDCSKVARWQWKIRATHSLWITLTTSPITVAS